MDRNPTKDLAVIKIQITKAGLADPVAFSNIAWNTDSSSPGDELMTFGSSDVAVSVTRSSNSRARRAISVFSGRQRKIAMARGLGRTGRHSLVEQDLTETSKLT